MSLETTKQKLLGMTSEAGIKANAAMHLIMVLEHYESNHIGKMEALTKIRKCSNSHTGNNPNSNEVRKICREILDNI